MSRRFSEIQSRVVYLGHAQRLVAHADAVVHYQRRELRTIDEHDAAACLRGGVLRVLRERARGDEHPFDPP
jgi:hypothetical protein